MGVDFYTCKECSQTFPDCGPYTACRVCGGQFCDDKCAGAQRMTKKQVEQYCDCGEDFNAKKEKREVDPSNCSCTVCSYCRHEKITDEDLLSFALGLLKTDRVALGDKYRESLKK